MFAGAWPGFFWFVLGYGLPYIALWGAPVYAWYMLVSAWARRAPFLWAFGLPLAACLIERMALGGNPVIGRGLLEALLGGVGQAFTGGGEGGAPLHDWADVDLVRLAAQPHLWIGLAVAAALLFAAVRLRRTNQPL